LLGLGDLQRVLKLFDLVLRIRNGSGSGNCDDFFLPEAAKEGLALAKNIADRNTTITTASVAEKAT